MEKRCSRCRITKSLFDFNVNNSRPDKINTWCKDCCKISRDSYYSKNKEKLKPVRQKWNEENFEYIKSKRRKSKVKDPRKTMLYSARHRAKLKNLPFDIELNDIVIPEICPVLKVPFDFETSRQTRLSPSIDKIIPSLGYVKGNIQVISWLANTMKNNATIDELLLFAQWILENFNTKETNE